MAAKNKFNWEVVEKKSVGRSSSPSLRVSRTANGVSLTLTPAARALLGIKPPTTNVTVLFDKNRSAVGVKLDKDGRALKVPAENKQFVVAASSLAELIPQGKISISRPATMDESSGVLYADFSGDVVLCPTT